MIEENGRVLRSWELSDAFYSELEPLLSSPKRDT